jgi:hypothetical protein
MSTDEYIGEPKSAMSSVSRGLLQAVSTVGTAALTTAKWIWKFHEIAFDRIAEVGEEHSVRPFNIGFKAVRFVLPKPAALIAIYLEATRAISGLGGPEIRPAEHMLDQFNLAKHEYFVNEAMARIPARSAVQQSQDNMDPAQPNVVTTDLGKLIKFVPQNGGWVGQETKSDGSVVTSLKNSYVEFIRSISSVESGTLDQMYSLYLGLEYSPARNGQKIARTVVSPREQLDDMSNSSLFWNYGAGREWTSQLFSVPDFPQAKVVEKVVGANSEQGLNVKLTAPQRIGVVALLSVNDPKAMRFFHDLYLGIHNHREVDKEFATPDMQSLHGILGKIFTNLPHYQQIIGAPSDSLNMAVDEVRSIDSAVTINGAPSVKSFIESLHSSPFFINGVSLSAPMSANLLFASFAFGMPPEMAFNVNSEGGMREDIKAAGSTGYGYAQFVDQTWRDDFIKFGFGRKIIAKLREMESKNFSSSDLELMGVSIASGKRGVYSYGRGNRNKIDTHVVIGRIESALAAAKAGDVSKVRALIKDPTVYAFMYILHEKKIVDSVVNHFVGEFNAATGGSRKMQAQENLDYVRKLMARGSAIRLAHTAGETGMINFIVQSNFGKSFTPLSSIAKRLSYDVITSHNPYIFGQFAPGKKKNGREGMSFNQILNFLDADVPSSTARMTLQLSAGEDLWGENFKNDAGVNYRKDAEDVNLKFVEAQIDRSVRMNLALVNDQVVAIRFAAQPKQAPKADVPRVSNTTTAKGPEPKRAQVQVPQAVPPAASAPAQKQDDQSRRIMVRLNQPLSDRSALIGKTQGFMPSMPSPEMAEDMRDMNCSVDPKDVAYSISYRDYGKNGKQAVYDMYCLSATAATARAAAPVQPVAPVAPPKAVPPREATQVNPRNMPPAVAPTQKIVPVRGVPRDLWASVISSKSLLLPDCAGEPDYCRGWLRLDSSKVPFNYRKSFLGGAGDSCPTVFFKIDEGKPSFYCDKAKPAPLKPNLSRMKKGSSPKASRHNAR